MRYRATSGIFPLAISAAVLAPPGATAQTFDIKQLDVKQGSLEAGLDNTVQSNPRGGSDSDRSAHDLSLDYGLRDWWRLSGVLKLEKPEDNEFRVSRTAVENIFVLRALNDKLARDLGFGWFTSVEASVHAETTNSLIFGPIVTLKSDKLSFTVNPFLEKTFGRNRDDGIALNYGWSLKYEVRNGLAIGVEGFGVVDDLGNSPGWSAQEHRVGPVIFTEIALSKDFKISPDVGLLFGLTRGTPDVALKLNVGVPLNQR